MAILISEDCCKDRREPQCWEWVLIKPQLSIIIYILHSSALQQDILFHNKATSGLPPHHSPIIVQQKQQKGGPKL